MKQASLLHPRNIHAGRYNLFKLSKAHKPLVGHIQRSPTGDKTINFGNPKAVLALNTALLKVYYGIDYYDIPEGFLCPPIPGRADYIHYLADLLATDGSHEGARIIDIGTGANIIYPILGNHLYKWRFKASELNTTAFESANKIVERNKLVDIEVVKQASSNAIFDGVINEGEMFDAVMCNPPFHTSAEEAAAGSNRKVRQLGKHKKVKAVPKLNFSGQANELWCDGGEVGFIKRMIKESVRYKNQVRWFTSLVSKSDSLNPLKKSLKVIEAKEVRIIKMAQGSKESRFIAWRL